MQEKHMSKIPKVAILMATYNGEKYLREQILSVLKQRGVDLTIFISDDCSSDSTLQIISNLSLDYHNVHVISLRRRYGSASANFYSIIINLKLNEFDYVGLSDQDDIWSNNKIRSAIKCMKKSDSEAYSSDVIAFWDNGKERYIKKSYRQTKYDYLFESPGPGCTFLFSSCSYRFVREWLSDNRDSLHMTGSGQHDWLLYAVIRSSGRKWYIDGSSYVRYRQHDDNVIGASASLKAYLNRLSMIRSGWYRERVDTLSYLLLSRDNSKVAVTNAFILKNINQTRRKIVDRIVLFLCVIFGWY